MCVCLACCVCVAVEHLIFNVCLALAPKMYDNIMLLTTMSHTLLIICSCDSIVTNCCQIVVLGLDFCTNTHTQALGNTGTRIVSFNSKLNTSILELERNQNEAIDSLPCADI